MCTWGFGRPCATGLIESSKASNGGSQDPPAEHGDGVHADELPHAGTIAAPQQGNDVRTHVVRVLLTKILVRFRHYKLPTSRYRFLNSLITMLTLTWYLTFPAKCLMTKAGSMTGVGTKYLFPWCCCLNLASNVSSVARGKLRWWQRGTVRVN